jgi:hypothetical protein
MAKKVLSSLKGIIKEAQRKGKIAKNPAEPVTIKVLKRGTRKIRAGRDFPSKAEINTILQKAAGRWRPVLAQNSEGPRKAGDFCATALRSRA